MLCDWKQFDMGESHLDHVGQERVGKFDVTERTSAFLDLPLPGPEVDLVDAEGLTLHLFLCALLYPFLVAPLEALEIKHHRGGRFPVLTEKPKRVALQE